MTKSTITREPITHDIKIYPEFFSAVCTGVKRAELRKNDRDYRVGDTLHLMETPRGSCHQTGEFINVKITHIADVGEWIPDYVLLSVELQERRKADSEPVILYRQVNPVNGMKTYWAELDPEEFRHLKQHTDENAEFMTLYRHAQPAPVVPEKCPAEIRDLIASHSDALFNDDDAQEIWNACRSAMLASAQQSPGSEPATVPGEWIPVSEQKPDCWCLTCRPVTLNDMRFVVCPDCGNKRCPRANDHRDACTGSNEPGQEGSVYPAAQQEVK
ncbi:TPA: DUF3850 domain-containing protein [Klebsiella pneumoniae]